MSLKCSLGLHSWSGCKCTSCGKARDENHAWEGCKCTVCGKDRDREHVWDGCKCTVCSKTRNQDHHWDGCMCQTCGQTRDQEHDWQGCKCHRCGKTSSSGHSWVKGKCTLCGTIINAQDEHKETLLHKAAAAGLLADVQELVAAGADIEIQDRNSCTPLHHAMLWPEVATYLTHQGANPHKASLGGSLLHGLTMGKGQAIIDAARSALPLVSDMEIRDHRGYTALGLSALCQHPVVACILLANGADADKSDSERNSAVNIASTMANLAAQSRVFWDAETGAQLGSFSPIETLAILTHWRPHWNYRSSRFDTYNCASCGARHSQYEVSLQPAQAMICSPTAKDSHRAALQVAGASHWTCPACEAKSPFPPELGR